MNLFSYPSQSLRWSGIFMTLLFGLHSSPVEATPVFEPVYGFEISPTNPQSGVIQGSDGNFYGTTPRGGCFTDGSGNGYGTVFKITPSGVLTNLVNFDFTNGKSPIAGLVQGSDGNFYGTTLEGGSGGRGTVFKITAGGTLTTLVNFDWFRGSRPTAALVQGIDGNFYGTTSEGGSGSNGTAFMITPAGILTTLVNFNIANGSSPNAALVQGSDGNFYGTTVRGGASSFGTVFKMTPSGVLTTLVHFNGSNGRQPSAALVDGGDGSFYGTTELGGSFGNTNGSGYGTIFKITPGGVLTTLVNLSNDNGSHPSSALLRNSDGNFYGMTVGGGSYSDFFGTGYGTIFRMTPSGNLTTLVNFARTNGARPVVASLVKGRDENFYGTTFFGGSSEQGTVFRMTAAGALTTLVNFTTAVASEPNTLLQGRDGNLYGTTRSGGIFRDNFGTPCGSVFRITLSGELTTLASFNSVNGRNPGAVLVEDNEGNFYGTTERGGSSDYGTVFKMTPQGDISTLVHFSGSNGQFPYSALLGVRDGNIYGTVSNGGINDRGTVFRIAPTGILTTLIDFTEPTGSNPYTLLMQGNDGNFYGRTELGGSNGTGTVIKMTPAGVLTTAVNLTGTVGGTSISGLLQASDGNFYGTTLHGPGSSDGTVFKIAASGVVTRLVNFNGGNGASPAAPLLEGSDGSFYGTTKNPGTAFRMTPDGTLITLTRFTGANGRFPTTALIRGMDGHLYGTTRDGGNTPDGRPAGGGQIYRLRMGPTATSRPQTNVTPSSATLNGTINPGGYATTVSFRYGTDPTLATFSTVAAGTLPAGTLDLAVQATLSNIGSGPTYYFRVVASSIENTVPQLGSILSFTTQGARSVFSDWSATQFSSGQLSNPLVSGLAADPDNDGVVNLLEYAFNLNPLIPETPILIANTSTSGLPLIRRTESPTKFSIQYLRRKKFTNSGITYLPQFSSGLDGQWSAFTGVETIQSIDATWERVTVEYSANMQQKSFGRLKVISEP